MSFIFFYKISPFSFLIGFYITLLRILISVRVMSCNMNMTSSVLPSTEHVAIFFLFLLRVLEVFGLYATLIFSLIIIIIIIIMSVCHCIRYIRLNVSVVLVYKIKK